MSRDEFLQGLQNALSGEVPPEIVRDNLRYYDDYMRAERQKGRAEAEILEELGDPRLIARTIIDTTPGAGSGGFAEYRGGMFGGGSYSGSTYTEYEEENSQATGQGSYRNGNVHYYDLNKWYWKLLGLVVVIVIFTLIIAVVGGLLTLLVPLLPGVILIAAVFWFMGGSRR